MDQPADLAPGHRPARGPSAGSCVAALGSLARPAPERPYHPAYHPFKWRGWWDFGTGALGDMGCHIIDAAFWALDLRAPRSIEAESPPISPHPETAPAWSIVRYDFDARGSRPPVKLIWYDGGKLPPLRALRRPCSGEGLQRLYLRGRKGAAAVGKGRVDGATGCFPNASLPAMSSPSPRWRALPAIMPSGSRPARRANPRVRTLIIPPQLTEIVLLGNVALRAGRRIEWDAAGVKGHQRFP